MSNELEDIARCLFNGQIPNGWRRLAPDTLKNLGNWILHFNDRLEQYNKWVRYAKYMYMWCKILTSLKFILDMDRTFKL